MAIHPGYAHAILDGRKQVEFRKRSLASDVTTVVIYATTPEKRILGEFSIDRTLVGPPAELWATIGAVGEIDEASYALYFAGSEKAAGIVISCARRYPTGVPLAGLNPEPAVPQSFTYVSGAMLRQIRDLGGADRKPLLTRLVHAIGGLARSEHPHEHGRPGTPHALVRKATGRKSGATCR